MRSPLENSKSLTRYPKMKQLIKGQISYKAVSYFQNERVQDITTEFWQLSTDFNEIVSKPWSHRELFQESKPLRNMRQPCCTSLHDVSGQPKFGLGVRCLALESVAMVWPGLTPRNHQSGHVHQGNVTAATAALSRLTLAAVIKASSLYQFHYVSFLPGDCWLFR